MEQDYDFRDQEPLWVKYAEYVGNGSDKFWECRVDLADSGEFVLTTRWGPRPDRGRGQIKTEYYTSMVHTTNNADAKLGAKLRKGYRLVDRPLAASNQVFKETGPDYYDPDAEAF
jgi:predicted DNA-binding WGR domain protein